MHRRLALLSQASHKVRHCGNVFDRQLNQLQGDAADDLGQRLDGLSLGRDFIGRCALLEGGFALKRRLLGEGKGISAEALLD
jgi:hypothetical protein